MCEHIGSEGGGEGDGSRDDLRPVELLSSLLLLCDYSGQLN